MSWAKFNKKAVTNDATGFGTNSNLSGGRFFTKNGIPNRAVRGINFLERFSVFHSLLALPRWKFLAIIFLFYITINIVFAGVYLLIGVEHIAGIIKGSVLQNFGEMFFFSTQTFTTVGYGRISPVGFLASTVAALEAMLGLLSFALATGLLYARFSKPQAFLKFSKNALITPYKNGTAVMFRMVPYKNNHLTEAEVKANVAMKVQEDGARVNRFYSLQFEIAKINTLALSWTMVHVIDDNSPFYNLSKEDIINSSTEILVFVRGFDESFSNTVVSRTSYTANEFVFGAKFRIMYNRNEDDSKTILNIDKLDDYEVIELPALPDAKSNPSAVPV